MRAAEPTSPAGVRAARRRVAAACLLTPAVSRRAVVAARSPAGPAGRAGGRRTGPCSRIISPAPVAGGYGRVLSRAAAVAAGRVMTPVPAGRCRRVPTRVAAVAAPVMTPVPAGHGRGTTQIRAAADGAATNPSPIAHGMAVRGMTPLRAADGPGMTWRQVVAAGPGTARILAARSAISRFGAIQSRLGYVANRA